MACLRSGVVFTATLESLARLARKDASPPLLVANLLAGLLLFDLGGLALGGGPRAVSTRGAEGNDGIDTALLSGSSGIGWLHCCGHAVRNALTVARFTEDFEKVYFAKDTAGERRLWGVKEKKSRAHMVAPDWFDSPTGLRRPSRHMPFSP